MKCSKALGDDERGGKYDERGRKKVAAEANHLETFLVVAGFDIE